MRRSWLVLPLLLLLGGCVYYNGMYNTKRLAKRARNAEKDGRTFEASNLWGQVSVKAETLLVSHPRSKYAEEARLLYGTARVKLNDCARALPDLEQVMLTARNPAFAEDAAELVGNCRVLLGDPISAAQVYSRLTTSRNAARRDLALFAHGQALRLNGEYDAAYAELAQTQHRRAQGERAAALAGAGKLDAAGLVIDSLVQARDTLAPWVDITLLVSRHDLAAGTTLTDRLVGWTALSSATRGRILIDEAERVSRTDNARAEARLEEVARVAPGSERVVEARLLLIERRIARASDTDTLRAIADELGEQLEGALSFTPRMTRLIGHLRKVSVAADSVAAGAPSGDLRLFITGEMARDSLGALRFAGRQFRRVVDEWPASPYAPKALLALIVLEPAESEQRQAQMRERYASSPYLLAVDGMESPELATLEDSLRRFAATFEPGRGAPVRVTPARPGSRPNRPAPSSTEPAL